jgi:hypothetical protein
MIGIDKGHNCLGKGQIYRKLASEAKENVVAAPSPPELFANRRGKPAVRSAKALISDIFGYHVPPPSRGRTGGGWGS